MRAYVTLIGTLILLLCAIGSAIVLAEGGLCGPTESQYECTREWVIAIGPIAGLVAAMVAAYFVYLQIAGLREQNQITRKSQATLNLSFQSERLALLCREFPTGAPLRDQACIVDFNGDHYSYWSQVRATRIGDRYISSAAGSLFLELESFVTALTAASQDKASRWDQLLSTAIDEYSNGKGGWSAGDSWPVLQKPTEMSDAFKSQLEAYAKSETEYLQREADLNAASKKLAARLTNQILKLHDELKE